MLVGGSLVFFVLIYLLLGTCFKNTDESETPQTREISSTLSQGLLDHPAEAEAKSPEPQNVVVDGKAAL